MNYITVNKNKNIFYVADNSTAGLTDLIIEVKNQSSVIVSQPMEDVGNGCYVGSFIPTTLNDYTVKITSVINGDYIIKVYEAVAYDILDAVTKINSVETKVNALDVKVIDVATDVNALDTKLDTVSAKADVISVKTDDVKVVVNSNSAKLDVIDTKINNLPTAKRYGYFA